MAHSDSKAETSFDPSKYLTKIGNADYLEVRWRILWLREVHPDATIDTELIKLIPVGTDPEGIMQGYAVFKATVQIPGGGRADRIRRRNRPRFQGIPHQGRNQGDWPRPGRARLRHPILDRSRLLRRIARRQGQNRRRPGGLRRHKRPSHAPATPRAVPGQPGTAPASPGRASPAPDTHPAGAGTASAPAPTAGSGRAAHRDAPPDRIHHHAATGEGLQPRRLRHHGRRRGGPMLRAEASAWIDALQKTGKLPEGVSDPAS